MERAAFQTNGPCRPEMTLGNATRSGISARASDESGLLACCRPGTCRVPRISSLTELNIPLLSFSRFYNIV